MFNILVAGRGGKSGIIMRSGGKRGRKTMLSSMSHFPKDFAICFDLGFFVVGLKFLVNNAKTVIILCALNKRSKKLRKNSEKAKTI